MTRITMHITKYLIAGLFVLLPIGITWWVLKFLFNMVDTVFRPLVTVATAHDIPGVGVVIAIILLYIAGIIGKNVVGKRLLAIVQQSLLRIPVVKGIYSISKKMVDAFDPASSATGFNKVVLVEYPSKGAFSLGIPVAETSIDNISHIVVYFPTAPTPQSGLIALFPKETVRETTMTVKEFMGLTLSLGLSSPKTIGLTNRENR